MSLICGILIRKRILRQAASSWDIAKMCQNYGFFIFNTKGLGKPSMRNYRVRKCRMYTQQVALHT